jgi:hypothetical protein
LRVVDRGIDISSKGISLLTLGSDYPHVAFAPSALAANVGLSVLPFPNQGTSSVDSGQFFR